MLWKSSDFNPENIQEESLRRIYTYQAIRANEVYSSFSAHYPRGKKRILDYKYIKGDKLRAYTTSIWKYDKIRVSSPTIYMVRSLCDQLLANEGFLPTIVGSDKYVKRENIPNFLADPFEVNFQLQGEAPDNANRLLFSDLMADMCATFILCHEIGHIICGHTTFFKTLFNSECLDFFSITSSKDITVELKQAMEYDADIVASALLPQYIEQLSKSVKSNKRHQEIFKEVISQGKLQEDILMLSLMFLYAMFVYIQGRGELKYNAMSEHPHPLLRAMYVKDAVITRMKERNKLDLAYILEKLPMYFDQFDERLEQFSLNQPEVIIEDIFRRQDGLMQGLIENAKIHRGVCRHYSWLPPEEWN